jgi:hypothetical protein
MDSEWEVVELHKQIQQLQHDLWVRNVALRVMLVVCVCLAIVGGALILSLPPVVAP